MAIIGITTNKTNPSFTSFDFTFWMPQFKKFMETDEGSSYFNKLYGIANKKIFYSIYGSDWEYAMSLCIAHYLTLISNQLDAPAGSSLEEIAGGGTIKGILSSASIGDFSKSYELGLTTVDSDESKFWNQTSYGAALMALYKAKFQPSIFVVTNDPITRR